jgi:hypothetical protein
MLDLMVAMLKVLLAIVLLLFLQDSPPGITSPQPGETLRGQVNISGGMNVTNFSSAELAFAYASDPTSTWFTIQTFSSPVFDPGLAVWDTTVLTDGNYALRLRVNQTDGSSQEILVTDLHIRNDAPASTDTPIPEPVSTLAPSLPTSTVAPVTVSPSYPTPTPLPGNPASLLTSSIYSNFARGTALTLILFFIVGILLRLRRS